MLWSFHALLIFKGGHVWGLVLNYFNLGAERPTDNSGNGSERTSSLPWQHREDNSHYDLAGKKGKDDFQTFNFFGLYQKGNETDF